MILDPRKCTGERTLTNFEKQCISRESSLRGKLVIRGTLNILGVYVEFRRSHSMRGLSKDLQKEYTL